MFFCTIPLIPDLSPLTPNVENKKGDKIIHLIAQGGTYLHFTLCCLAQFRYIIISFINQIFQFFSGEENPAFHGA